MTASTSTPPRGQYWNGPRPRAARAGPGITRSGRAYRWLNPMDPSSILEKQFEFNFFTICLDPCWKDLKTSRVRKKIIWKFQMLTVSQVQLPPRQFLNNDRFLSQNSQNWNFFECLFFCTLLVLRSSARWAEQIVKKMNENCFFKIEPGQRIKPAVIRTIDGSAPGQPRQSGAAGASSRLHSQPGPDNLN